jgi:hypothetical protein
VTYIEGEVGRGDSFIPYEGGRFDRRLPDYVWSDSALEHLGSLIRAYHDAAATFPWAGREWAFEPRRPVETVCHNELSVEHGLSAGRPGGVHRLGHRSAAGRRDRWTALVAVILLLVIVFLKGTSPGGPRAREEFQASKDRGGQ